MGEQYTIDIINGTSKNVISEGIYAVTGNVIGYLNESITPTSITVNNTEQIYDFTITASGQFIINVTEDGLIPVVGAKFIRCDSNGFTYGSEIITNSDGDATFFNVPFDVNRSVKIYYKQTQSDENHSFNNTLKNITLTSSYRMLSIINPLL